MKTSFSFYLVLLFALSISNFGFANPMGNPPKKELATSSIKSVNKTHSFANTAPTITATGNNTYCPLASANIATTISITNSDPSQTSTDAIYIQISSGYVNGEDLLTLNNSTLHPTITGNWNVSEGKLTLSSPISGTPVTYADFEKAIKDVQFSSSSATPSGIRNFSISIGQANYLPRNGHYYLYFADLGINWTKAKDKANASTYYGLKGYLATLTASDEALLAGKQAPGAGWIGGSDAAVEGEWRWVTGPEGLANGGTGIVFWNGTGGGSTPNFAYWNTMNNEPNQSGDEDYAHITAPGIGIPGSWNDLQETGDSSGNYQPKGYIVEYGGTPGDPILQLTASTTLTVASITSVTPASRCDAGTLTLQAIATTGTINWYDAATGGNYKGTGPNFTTPIIYTTTTYYVETTTATCASNRTAVEAKINITPTITTTNSPVTNCGAGIFTLSATPSSGTINWYSQIGGNIVGTGPVYITQTVSSATTYYAQAFNNECINSTKELVQLIVYPLPAVTDETVKQCGSDTALLDASIPNMTYLWNTGETTQTIEAPTTGIYTVDVTSPNPENCTSRKTITVIENKKPGIKEIKIDDTTVAIELIKNEDYFEYSIDGINFQNSNTFTNVPSGLQTAYVRDTDECNIDIKSFIIIIVPKFFTPNNDNVNDFWEVKGLADYPLGEVTLFDRYGKLITLLNRSNRSWDGTLNKNPLPASDYWYVLKLDPSSPEVKGHFSLKR